MDRCRPASEPSRPFDPSPRRAAISHVTDAGPQGGGGRSSNYFFHRMINIVALILLRNHEIRDGPTLTEDTGASLVSGRR